MAHRQLGKYQLEKRLAVGGMAEVFLARQLGPADFEKQLVIKCIHPVKAEDKRLVTMFLDEARLAAQLTHPNIVQIYELGQEDGIYFIAMEYVDGAPLNDLAYRADALGAGLPYHYIAAIVAEVCAGLNYAHRFRNQAGEHLGLVHRDVSPENILIARHGAVKTIDFGIAKSKLSRADSQTGALKGKWNYMSPEQINQEELDGRSDIFSLGVVLYEAVSGQLPFRDEPGLGALMSILNDQPAPLDHEVPPALAEIALQAMHKDPGQRFQSARQMQRELEEFIQSHAEAVSDADLGDLMATLNRAESCDVVFLERLAAECSRSVAVSLRQPRPTPLWAVHQPEPPAPAAPVTPRAPAAPVTPPAPVAPVTPPAPAASVTPPAPAAPVAPPAPAAPVAPPAPPPVAARVAQPVPAPVGASVPPPEPPAPAPAPAPPESKIAPQAAVLDVVPPHTRTIEEPLPSSELTFRRPGRRRGRAILAVAAVALLALGVVGVWLLVTAGPTRNTWVPPVERADVRRSAPEVSATPDVAPPQPEPDVPPARAERDAEPTAEPDTRTPGEQVMRFKDDKLRAAKRAVIALREVPLGVPCEIGGQMLGRDRLKSGVLVAPGTYEILCDDPTSEVWRFTVRAGLGERVLVRYR